MRVGVTKVRDWTVLPFNKSMLKDHIPFKLGKHIPIECWSEIKEDTTLDIPGIYDFMDFDLTKGGEIRNSGGRTYLVTVKEQL
jgi:hypothetical protein